MENPELTKLLYRKIEIEEELRNLAIELTDLDNLIGVLMDKRKVTLEGIGLVQRLSRKRMTQWDNEDLLRVVLDTRMVNESTGEVLEETPLQKVLKVWNLGAPRKGVLKERGIQADEFCQVENQDGWSIRIF